VPQDYTKARELYELAISKGQQFGEDNLKAPLELSAMYENGHGVQKDRKTAIRILVEALVRPENQQSRHKYQLQLRRLLQHSSGLDSFIDVHIQLLRDNEQLKHEIEALRLEMTYCPGGEGYQQAKDHFDSLTQPRPNQTTTN
jgi:TPR repeat protein